MKTKLKKIYNRITNLIGYKVTRIHIDKSYENDFLIIYNKCKEYSMTSKDRMYALYKSIEYIIKNKIPGDLVECGVWKGGNTMLMAYTLLHFNDNTRNIYLYDTYEGMTKPTKEDIHIHKGTKAYKLWRNTDKFCYASLHEVKHNMSKTKYPSNKLTYVKGKVEDTIPNIIPDTISILRLDTDWYQSTKHELQHLFPILKKNGVLIIDDYGCWKGSKKAVDEYFAKHNNYILLNKVENTRLGIKI